MMDDPFLFRTMSSFPLSIGTGLMLESVFKPTSVRYDEKREIPNKVNIDNYKYHIYNIGTLVRNILSASNQKTTAEILANANFKNALIGEITTLVELYAMTKCKPVIFIPNYTNVYKALNNEKIAEATVEILNNELIFKAVEKIDVSRIIAVQRDSYRLPRLEGACLITTSYPVDLLNPGMNLTLLESHTGKLKEKWEWYTKYHKIGSKDMSVFPFMEVLLYFLGDTTMINPCNLSIRNELHKVALSNNWTSRTTRDKVIADIYKNATLKDTYGKYKKIF